MIVGNYYNLQSWETIPLAYPATVDYSEFISTNLLARHLFSLTICLLNVTVPQGRPVLMFVWAVVGPEFVQEPSPDAAPDCASSAKFEQEGWKDAFNPSLPKR